MDEAAFEQVQGRARVLAHGTGGIGTRTRGIRDPGEVEYRVAACDQRANGRIARIDPNRLARAGSFGAVRARRANDFVAVLREQVGRARAEKPRRPCDEELHRRR